MASPIDRNVKGRLQLWNLALFEAQQLLEGAGRARAARDTHTLHSGEVTADQRKPAFANWYDLNDVADNFTLLAIVLYAQVFNQGDGSDSSSAVRNQSGDAQRERSAILTKAFPTADKRAAFDSVHRLLMDARDKVVAHADARMFGLSVGKDITVSRTHATVLEVIDLAQFSATVNALLQAVQARMRELNVTTYGWVG